MKSKKFLLIYVETCVVFNKVKYLLLLVDYDVL